MERMTMTVRAGDTLLKVFIKEDFYEKHFAGPEGFKILYTIFEVRDCSFYSQSTRKGAKKKGIYLYYESQKNMNLRKYKQTKQEVLQLLDNTIGRSNYEMSTAI